MNLLFNIKYFVLKYCDTEFTSKVAYDGINMVQLAYSIASPRGDQLTCLNRYEK
jgi:hypothetical protein